MTSCGVILLVPVVLTSAVTPGRGPAFGEPGGLGGVQEPANSVRDAGGGQVAPIRSADKVAQSVGRFADVLMRHPARRLAAGGGRLQLYMLDLVKGGTTLLADEPVPGLDCCSTPKWSHDGSRVVFGARPRTRFEASRILAIEVHDGRPTCADLGPGNCPTFSPTDQRIAFMLSPGAEPGAEAGVWVMQADGSDRRRVSEDVGAPFWSPDGREILLCGYDDRCIVLNLETKEGGVVAVPGQRIFSWPSWAGPGTLVSALAAGQEGDSIALIDVRKPAEAKVIEVLWKRSAELDVTPRWPVYREDARLCYFAGEEPAKRTLLSVRRGEPGRVKRLEPRGYDDKLSGLAFSPDGRYLLFCADRPAP